MNGGSGEAGPFPLVLASASPRRAAQLRALGMAHEVVVPRITEALRPGESPEAHAERLAKEKAEAVVATRPEAWVLASDTVVVLDGDVLGKPADAAEASSILLRLQGRTHRVISALALRRPPAEFPPREKGGAGPARPGPTSPERTWSEVAVTSVTFRPFGAGTAEAYVATGEPMDKAGGYGIQGLGAVLVERVEGDYTAVVGLPVSLLVTLLERAGRPYRFPPPPEGPVPGRG